jgi:transglutaminase-like putative cysteine protease
VPYLRTDHHPDVRAFAQQVAQKADWNTLRFLGELNRNLFEGTNHVVRQTGAPLGPAETLTSRKGSCRDTAVLFCATCRAMGIAARFVSGYELGSAMQQGSGDLHAWAEVYLQGGGWRGYDPSRGLAVADGHIPIAAASDASLAAPVTGTFRGQAQTTMDFQIAMQLL